MNRSSYFAAITILAIHYRKQEHISERLDTISWNPYYNKNIDLSFFYRKAREGRFKMKQKKYQVFCQFKALGEKTVYASNLEEAIEMVAEDESTNFDAIVRLHGPCKVVKSLTLKANESQIEEQEHINYKNWGSE